MSALIQMRQRIKAIETIKKVTHAMRLIAMSAHARLRAQKSTLDEYNQAINSLLEKLYQTDSGKHSILQPQHHSGLDLIIVVGSQKGLCGNFNINLLTFFNHQMTFKNPQQTHLIVVGKKLIDMLSANYGTIVMQFKAFSGATLPTITQKITDYSINSPVPYRSITVYANYPKTFFAQKPASTVLVPFEPAQTQESLIEYRWEHDREEIINNLIRNHIQSTLRQLLLQSLIAEQAARFIAMDNSTKNASNLLDTMKLNYNKLRQTKITRELTDLIATTL